MKKFTLIIIALVAALSFSSCGTSWSTKNLDKMHEAWRSGDLKVSEITESEVDGLLERYSDLVVDLENNLNSGNKEKCGEIVDNLIYLDDIFAAIKDENKLTSTQEASFGNLIEKSNELSYKFFNPESSSIIDDMSIDDSGVEYAVDGGGEWN